MASIIELEASYHLDEKYNNEILDRIKKENFKFKQDIIEEDTYYTDKDLNFIKDRVCLRIRKINENFLELTYKPKTDNNSEKYGKREINLKLNPHDYYDTKYIIEELGYIEYVSFKKHRKIFSKIVNGFVYNIMIDEIEGVGRFIELEILANTEEEKNKLHDELDKFIEKMGCGRLNEKRKPYRDIVKDHKRRG